MRRMRSKRLDDDLLQPLRLRDASADKRVYVPFHCWRFRLHAGALLMAVQAVRSGVGRVTAFAPARWRVMPGTCPRCGFHGQRTGTLNPRVLSLLLDRRKMQMRL